MTHVQLLSMIQSMFGAYQNDVQKKMVFEFLVENIPVEKTEEFMRKLTISYSSNIGRPPLPADVYKIFGPHKDVQAEKAWQSLLGKSGLHDVLIVDPYAQEVVAGFGSWYFFCQQRDSDQREWLHKTFLNRYKTYSMETMRFVPIILMGELTANGVPAYPPKEPEIIGDKESGIKLLNEIKMLEEKKYLSFYKKVEP